MPATASKEYLNPPEVARLLGINVNKILTWIANGSLPAVNVAERLDGARPRWRISRAALDAFLASRTPAASRPAPTRKPRPKRDPGYVSYYTGGDQ
jgi:excisionase family DNA binding protein